MGRDIRVKGTVLSGLVRTTGAAPVGPTRDALLGQLAGEFRDAVQTNTLIPTVWYPLEWHRQLLAFAVQAPGGVAFGDAVRQSTRENVGTVYRAIMRIFSPETLISRSARIFATFFDAHCQARSAQVGKATVSWEACYGFDENCWQAQLFTLDELVAMTGATMTHRAVKEGGHGGDSTMTVELYWRG